MADGIVQDVSPRSAFTVYNLNRFIFLRYKFSNFVESDI